MWLSVCFHYFANSTLRYCFKIDNPLLILGILRERVAIWQKRDIRWNGVSFLLFCTVLGHLCRIDYEGHADAQFIGLYENSPASKEIIIKT